MLQMQSGFQSEVQNSGGKNQTKWVILALGSCLLILLTDLQFRRTHFHSYVSSYENYI